MVKKHSRYFFLGLALILLIISFFMIKPYIVPILTSVFLVYVSYPLYRLINNRLRNRALSSVIICILLVMVILLPVLFLLNSALAETRRFYTIALGYVEGRETNLETISENIYTKFGVRVDFSSMLQNAFTTFLNVIRGLLTSIPKRMLSIFITLFLTFFLFMDADDAAQKIFNYLPLKESEKQLLLNDLQAVTKAIIFGHLVTATIQSILGGIGFFVFGVESPIFWGLLMFFFALIPLTGPAFIYLPVSLSMLLSGIFGSDSTAVIKGIGLLLYGVIIISSVDNIVKPKIISEKVKIHPGIILLGVLGGINLFGIIGIVIGPMVLALLISLFKIYQEKASAQ